MKKKDHNSEEYKTWKRESSLTLWIYKRDGAYTCLAPESLPRMLKENWRKSTAKKLRKKVDKEWRMSGLPPDLLQNYINYRRTKQHNDHYPGGDFRMLRRTLPNGLEVQLMLFPNKETILHPILRFYATHVMSFIGGVFGAHLYYDTAEGLKSYEWDISDDRRKHRHSEKGKSKYTDRGWTFEEQGGECNRRFGNDEKVKMVDYEEIYKLALQSLHGHARVLPSWLTEYFGMRKQAFQVSTWLEDKRKISDISYKDHDPELDPKKSNVLHWVHDDLDGHSQVVPKHLWDQKEDTMFVQLDLWFGGVGGLAQEMLYRRDGWGLDSDSESDSYSDLEPDSDSCWESDSDTDSESYSSSGTTLVNDSDSDSED
jgi:hypothetical protein